MANDMQDTLILSATKVIVYVANHKPGTRGDVLVLHSPNIKYILEICLGITCIVGGKNGKENMEGLKTVQLSINVRSHPVVSVSCLISAC